MENEKNMGKYGEMIPTAFRWMTQEEQKRKAEELQQATEKTSSNQNPSS